MTRLTDERIDACAEAVGIKCDPRFGMCSTGNVQLRSFARAIEAELSKQKPVARPRLPRIDHFAREAFEKFASGVECELTNYRWFEAGWDARGDTVAAAPLPSAPDTVQVPREPTIAMQDAFREADEQRFGPHFHDAYRAMLAAAPKEKD